jgi:hypothetical protein
MHRARGARVARARGFDSLSSKVVHDGTLRLF